MGGQDSEDTDYDGVNQYSEKVTDTVMDHIADTNRPKTSVFNQPESLPGFLSRSVRGFEYTRLGFDKFHSIQGL